MLEWTLSPKMSRPRDPHPVNPHTETTPDCPSKVSSYRRTIEWATSVILFGLLLSCHGYWRPSLFPHGPTVRNREKTQN